MQKPGPHLAHILVLLLFLFSESCSSLRFSECFPVICGLSIITHIKIHHHFSIFFLSVVWCMGPFQLSIPWMKSPITLAYLDFMFYAVETCGYFWWMALECHCKRTDHLLAQSIYCKPSNSPSGSERAAHSYRGCGCSPSVCVSFHELIFSAFSFTFSKSHPIQLFRAR